VKPRLGNSIRDVESWRHTSSPSPSLRRPATGSFRNGEGGVGGLVARGTGLLVAGGHGPLTVAPGRTASAAGAAVDPAPTATAPRNPPAAYPSHRRGSRSRSASSFRTWRSRRAARQSCWGDRPSARLLILPRRALIDDLKGPLKPEARRCSPSVGDRVHPRDRLRACAFEHIGPTGLRGPWTSAGPGLPAWPSWWIALVTNLVNLIDGNGRARRRPGGDLVHDLPPSSPRPVRAGMQVRRAEASSFFGPRASAFLRHNYHPAKVFMGDCGRAACSASFPRARWAIEGRPEVRPATHPPWPRRCSSWPCPIPGTRASSSPSGC